MDLCFPEAIPDEKEKESKVYIDMEDNSLPTSEKSFMQFNQAAAFAEYTIKSFDIDENLTSYTSAKKRTLAEDILENVYNFLRSESLAFSIKNILLADFLPVESLILQHAFLNFATESSSFADMWKIFSISVHYHLKPERKEYSTELENLGKTFTTEDEKNSYSIFQDIFSEFENSTALCEAWENALSNFRKIAVKSEEQKTAFSFFSQKIQNILDEAKLINFIDKVDELINSGATIGFSQLSRSKLTKLLQKSLSFSLLFLDSHSPLITANDRDIIRKTTAIIRKIIYLSNYLPANEIMPFVVQYKQTISMIDEYAKVNDISQDLKLIETYINSRKEEFLPNYSTFSTFMDSLNDPSVKSSKVYENFINFGSVFMRNIPENMQISAAFDAIGKNLRTKNIQESLKEDSVIILRFYQSQIGLKKSMKESIDDVIESIDGALEEQLISENYVDFIKRLKLMFRIFRVLYESSTSHLKHTANNFFKYFPDTRGLKDCIKLLDIREEIKNEIKELNEEPMTKERTKEILHSISDFASSSLDDALNNKLGKLLFFISSMRSFYSSFIGVDAVTQDKYEFILEPNDETQKYVALIESLLEILDFEATASLQLCEKTFALALVTLYKPYAAKEVAERAYEGIKNAFVFRFPNLSFRFTTGICIMLRKLAQKGTINIPIDIIDNLEKSFKGMMSLSEDATPRKLYDAALNLKKATKLNSIFTGIILFSKALILLEKVSKSMTEVSMLLENNDTVAPALVSLTVVASSAQAVALMYQQIMGKEIVDTLSEIWPFNSKQTNLIIYSEADPESFRKIKLFLEKMHTEVPTLPKRTFIDAAHALIQECCVYANSLSIDPAIAKKVSLIIQKIIQISTTSVKNNDFDTFTRDTFGELYILLQLLERRPKIFSNLTAIDDIQNFRGMILEYMTFTHFKESFNTVWVGLHKIPEPYRPTFDKEIEFIEKESDESKEEAETYSFEEQLNGVKEAFADNEDAKTVLGKLSKLLDKPVISSDPVKVDQYLQRFMSRTKAASQRLEIKLQEVVAEKENLTSKAQSEISKETLALKGRIDDIEAQITRISQENERKQNALKSENEEVKRIYDEYRALKTEMDILSDLPDGVTLSDIDDTSDESSKSEPTQKSGDIIEYTRAIRDQNMKLRAAIQRANIIKKVPGLKNYASSEQDATTIELMKHRDQLRKEVRELEEAANGISTDELYDISGFLPLEIPDDVKSFIEMADKLRTGRESEVNQIDFLSGLDNTEKFVYELSQNRRDFASTAIPGAATGDSEEDTQDIY